MVAFDGVVRLVDPDFAGDFGWPGSTVGEALRMPAVGVIKDVLPRCLEFIGQAMVDGVGGEQPQAAVTVFAVVPGEEVSKVSLCVLGAAEATRVRRRVFDGPDALTPGLKTYVTSLANSFLRMVDGDRFRDLRSSRQAMTWARVTILNSSLPPGPRTS